MLQLLNVPIWAQWLLLLPLGLVLLVAAITDWRERKIFNWLTYPAALGAIVLHLLVFGFASTGIALLTGLGVIVLGLIILPFGWLGGGDIKLLAVIGLALGPAALYEIFFYAVLVGFIMGMALSLKNGYLIDLLKRLGRFIASIFVSMSTRTNVTTSLETDERAYLPFAIPIFFGAILATTDAYLEWPMILDSVRQIMGQLGP